MSNFYILDIQDLWAHLEPGVTAIKAAIGPDTNGPLSEVLTQLERLAQGAAAVAPFRAGDRVRLAKVPQLTPDSGWWGARYFMVYWATAVVRAVRLQPKGWQVGLIFDDDCWVDQDGQKRATPLEARGVYFFPADALALDTPKELVAHDTP